MKLMVMVACTALGLSCGCVQCMAFGGPFKGPPELREALRCEIRPATNNLTMGSRATVFMTVENTAAVEVQLPCPGTHESGLNTRMFLLAGQTTGTVERLSVPAFVFQGNLTEDQKKMLERAPEWWGHIYVPARWIAIPPRGREQFQALIEITPKAEDGGAVTLTTSVYGLQCEIEYTMWHGSGAYLETNQWTSVERIEKAKASGVFFLDVSRLWTGKMQSNIAPVTLTESPR